MGGNDAEAGLRYENLRLRLIRFFLWNRCARAEDLADAALDRLAGKLSEGAEPILDPSRYVTGIARMMVHEDRAGEIREQKVLALFSWWMAAFRRPEGFDEDHHRALSACIEKLSGENRNILERYYTGDSAERIRNRKELAAEIGIEANALRNRALRLRRQLEDCISGEFSGHGSRDGSPLLLTKKGEQNAQ